MWLYGTKLKGLVPLSPIRMVQLSLLTGCGCAGLALWHCPMSWLLFGSVEHPVTCSVHGGIIPRGIETMVPVWVKHRTLLLHLSLEEDADARAASRMDGVIHPRPYAPHF